MTIDEAIARERELVEMHRNNIVPKEDYHNMPWIDKNNEARKRSAEYHEQLIEWLEELKVIKKMDLSIPQHFTKEQSDWIKKYCINRNKEFYNKAIDDCKELTFREVVYCDSLNDRTEFRELAEQLKEKYNK